MAEARGLNAVYSKLAEINKRREELRLTGKTDEFINAFTSTVDMVNHVNAYPESRASVEAIITTHPEIIKQICKETVSLNDLAKKFPDVVDQLFTIASNDEAYFTDLLSRKGAAISLLKIFPSQANRIAVFILNHENLLMTFCEKAESFCEAMLICPVEYRLQFLKNILNSAKLSAVFFSRRINVISLLKMYPDNMTEILNASVKCGNILNNASSFMNLCVATAALGEHFPRLARLIVDQPSWLKTYLSSLQQMMVLISACPDKTMQLVDQVVDAINLPSLPSEFIRITQKTDWTASQVSVLKSIIRKLTHKLNAGQECLSQLHWNQFAVLAAICPRDSQLLCEKLVKIRYPQIKTLPSIPFVIEQEGKNCGYYVLAAIQQFLEIRFVTEGISSTLFYPRKCAQIEKDLPSLRYIGKHEIKIPGIGGIFSAAELQNLIRKIGLNVNEITFTDSEQLGLIVKTAIDAGVPMMIPYLSDPTNKTPHYAAVVGYEQNDDKVVHILICQSAEFNLLSCSELYNLTNNIDIYPATSFHKSSMRGEYQETVNTLLYAYKKYTYPAIDLKSELKNKLFLISHPKQAHELSVNQDVQKLLDSKSQRLEH